MTICQEPGDSEHGLPNSIKTSLNNRYGPVPEVSSEIDRAILADARQHLSARVQPVQRHRRWNFWRWTALASTIVAASVMFLALRAPATGNDIDQNGRVDILDAFAMARLIRDGRSDGRDVNGDGRFDQRDVDVVANEAVML